MYTIRSDVWSSGLTLLELAMNRFPYPDDLDNPIELLSFIVRGEARLLFFSSRHFIERSLCS